MKLKYLSENFWRKKTKLYKNIGNNNYLITLKDKRKFLISRVGKCDYKKCNNCCCKFFCTSEPFFANFLKKAKYGNYIHHKKCRELSKGGKCKSWNNDKFPRSCKDFPRISDGHYWLVHKKCTFKFKFIGEVV